MSTEKAKCVVSVIVPAYNYAVFLPEAIASALRQTHSALEVIIVDDGSTDNTAAVAAQWVQQDQRVRYVHQVNQGLSAARNTGIKKSRGEFLVFLDADDVLHPEKLAAHLEHFAREPALDISYGSSRYFLSEPLSGNVPEKTFATLALDDKDWMPKVSGRAADVLPHLLVNNIMPVCSAMLRRGVVERVGEFDTRLKSLEDWDYWLRAAAQDAVFGYSEDARLAAFIRVHDISMSQNTVRMLQVQYQLRREVIPQYLEALPSRSLAAQLLCDNEKRRLRCLQTLAETMGATSAAFRQLVQRENCWQRVKLTYRLWRKRRKVQGN